MAHVCGTCDQSFTLSKNLSRHQRTFHSGQNVPSLACPQCSYVATNKSNLERHVLKRHANESPPAKRARLAIQSSDAIKTPQPSDHKCLVCNQQFTLAKNLLKHQRKYHSEQPPVFKCAVCSHETNTKYNLMTHEYAKHIKPAQKRRIDDEQTAAERSNPSVDIEEQSTTGSQPKASAVNQTSSSTQHEQGHDQLFDWRSKLKCVLMNKYDICIKTRGLSEFCTSLEV